MDVTIIHLLVCLLLFRDAVSQTTPSQPTNQDIFGTSCKSNDECNIAMPGNAKELDRALFICKNTVCTCSDGYYFNTKLDYCVQVFESICETTNDCVMRGNGTSQTVCELDPFGGFSGSDFPDQKKCLCKGTGGSRNVDIVTSVAYFYSREVGKCIKVIGGNCSDAGIFNTCEKDPSAECTPKPFICQCKEGFGLDKTKEICLPKSVGNECTNLTQCTRNDPNSYCYAIQDGDVGVCGCKSGFKVDQTYKICYPVVGSECKSNSECEGDPLSNCTDGKCVCKPGMFFNVTTRSCETVFNSSCDGNYSHCYLNDPRTTCRYSTTGLTCICNTGFYFNKTSLRCDHVLGSLCYTDEDCSSRYGNSRGNMICKRYGDDEYGKINACGCADGYYENFQRSICQRITERPLCPEGWILLGGGEQPARKKRQTFKDKRAVVDCPECLLPNATCAQYFDNPLSWQSALKSCHGNRSSLLVLSSKFWSQSYLVESMTNGLNLEDPNIVFWTGMYLTKPTPGRKLYWEGIYPHPVTARSRANNRPLWHWSPYHPIPPQGSCGAAFMNTTRQFPRPYNMTLRPCKDKLPYVCAHQVQVFQTSKLQQVSRCPTGWLGSNYHSKCYLPVKETNTFLEAEDSCKEKGGHLAQPKSVEADNFLMYAFQGMSVQRAWVGSSCNGNSTDCIWVDGEELSKTVVRRHFRIFTDISDSRVKRQTLEKRCVVVTQAMLYERDEGNSYPQLQWDWVDCSSKQVYVCERQALIAESNVVEFSDPIVQGDLQWTSPHSLEIDVNSAVKGYPISWIKDDLYNLLDLEQFIYTNQKNFTRAIRMPDIAMNFDQSGSLFGELQGLYRVAAWGDNPFVRYRSSTMMVRFKDIRTFVGSMKYAQFIYNPTLYLEPMLYVHEKYNRDSPVSKFWNDLREVGSKLRDELATKLRYDNLEDLGVSLVLSNLRYGMSGGLVVDFRLYIQIGQLKPNTVPDGSGIQPFEGSGIRPVETSQPLRRKRAVPFVEVSEPELLQLLQEQLVNVSKTLRNPIVSSSVELRSVEACPEDVTNAPDGRIISWPRTPIGKYSETAEPCLTDGRPLAQRTCYGDFYIGARWGEVVYACEIHYSEVTSTLAQLSRTPTSSENVDDVTSSAANLTATTNLTTPDVIYASKVLENIANVDNKTEGLSDNFLDIVNNVLGTKQEILADAQIYYNSSTRIAKSIEKFADSVSLGGKIFDRIVKERVAVDVWDVDISTPVLGYEVLNKDGNDNSTNLLDKKLNTIFQLNTLDFSITDVAITFPKEVYKNIGKSRVRVVFAVYSASSLFLSKQELNYTSVHSFVQTANSKVIAATVDGREITNLTNKVRTVYTPILEVENRVKNQQCSFWDFDLNDEKGSWSSEGCEYIGMREGKVICECDHLTNFAILVDVHGQDDPIDDDHTLALSIITIIGLALSIGGLSFVILTFLFFKKLRAGRSQQTLFNLALSILCSNIIFLVGIKQTQSNIGCIVVAALLHYFILVSFMWMLIEGILQYLKFVKVLGTYISRFMVKAAIPAWVIPAIPCVVILAVDYNWYKGGDQYCWMKTEIFYYAFLIPVCSIILANTIVFIMVIKGLTCDRPNHLQTNQSQRKIALLHLRAAICCLVVLGLTWVFGFFAISDARLVFQYLFCIFNSIQGFMIFIFHNIREPRVRDAWYQFCCNSRYKKEKYMKGPGVTHSHTHSDTTTSNGRKLSSGTATTDTRYYDNPVY